MATTTFSVPTNTSSDATYRTLGSSISGAIATVGMTQTSDTGQINWTTVTRPSVALSIAGYEIWRFSDTLQSTYPMFLRIEYGISTVATYLQMTFTVGTGTDGAGNLTGNISQKMIAYSSASENSTRTSYFSGGNNRLCFILWASPNTASYQYMVFSLERAHNSSGTDIGDGVHMFASSTVGLGISQFVPLGTTTVIIPPATVNPGTTVGFGWYCSAPLTGSGALGADFYTYPIKTYNAYETLPCFNLAHYMTGDITAFSSVSITGYDSTARTYLATGMIGSATSSISMTGCSTNVALLMRYD
jgi:hypothetical protein